MSDFGIRWTSVSVSATLSTGYCRLTAMLMIDSLFQFAEFFVNSNQPNFLEQRRMVFEIDHPMNHFIGCSFGRIGATPRGSFTHSLRALF